MSHASPHKPPKSIKSVDLPGASMPLYSIGALLKGTDLDAVAASDLEAFALHISEEKIREYYAEACEASVNFQRILATVDPSRRDDAQADFERHIEQLAGVKEREWKAITVKELRKHQAAEMERRAAQQRAMRPPPRKPLRREFQDWDYLDDYPSPRREHASPSTYHSPRREYLDAYHRSPRREYAEAYRSPRRDYVETYQSPRRDYLEGYQSPGSEFVESYQSSLQPRHRRRQLRPVNVTEEDAYAVSPSVDEFPQLKRRNALHRGEVYDMSDYDSPPPLAFAPLAPYQEEPQETGLLSGLTRWISNLG